MRKYLSFICLTVELHPNICLLFSGKKPAFSQVDMSSGCGRIWVESGLTSLKEPRAEPVRHSTRNG